MISDGPAGIRPRGILIVALIAAGIWNLERLEAIHHWLFYAGLAGNDWSLLAGLDPASPYADPSFHWSVPAAWIWSAIVPMGFVAWAALHFAALATIRDWRVVVLALATFPFWYDLASGNVLLFCLVAAWHALDGRRLGVVAFVTLAALVPRPLMLPVLAHLLWTRKDARWAFAAAAGVVIVSGLWTGTLDDWAVRLVATPGNELDASWNVGPSAILGALWVPFGIALGIYAWSKGHLGLASLAISPYVIHYYALFALLELRKPTTLARAHEADHVPTIRQSIVGVT